MSKKDTNIITTEELKRSADGWWRTQSATMALLKHAYSLIDDAEKKLAEQDRRIRQLEELAASDPLTGLLNRRGFERFFEMEQARIRRQHSPGALLMLIDLDKFKHINDAFGHRAGDECLNIVGKKLMQSTRVLDGVARFGGDEFAVLLTQIAPETALQHLDKIRQVLGSSSLAWEGEQLHFGASVGAALITGDGTFAEAYDAADKSLYDDKKSRRAPGHSRSLF